MAMFGATDVNATEKTFIAAVGVPASTGADRN
jgi:hypothetical protein